MVDRALVVESHFETRRRLARDLSDCSVAGEVVEASSVRDALEKLRARALDACLLGPRLQPSTALAILEEGRSIPLQRSCAFLVVAPESSNGHSLGAMSDGVVPFPYTPDSLKTSVNSALVNLLTAVSRNERPRLRGPRTHRDALEQLASDLRSIARGLLSRELVVQADGTPAAATDYALRRAFEQLIRSSSPAGTSSTPGDERFVHLVATWFHRRVRGEQNGVLDTLNGLLEKESSDLQRRS